MNVRAVFVDGDPARWRRDDDELVITPRKGLRSGRGFSTVIAYDGVPRRPRGRRASSTPTTARSSPASRTWRRAGTRSTTTRSTRPPTRSGSRSRAGCEAVANGELEGVNNLGRWTVWTWDAREPMASYLTTASIGEFDVKAYKADGIKYCDAIDPDLFTRPAPRTGRRFALSNVAEPVLQAADAHDRRPGGRREAVVLGRRATPSPTGTSSSSRRTPSGQDDWTTLPDLNGHTTQDTGFACPLLAELHPFLEHYQRENADGGCDPQGTTGTWNAISGASDGYEQWVVDLTPYAGKRVEVSLSYASDDVLQLRRRVRRRHRRSRAARARRRSRTTATCWTAGRRRARRRAASRTRTTGPSAPRPTRAEPAGERRAPRARPPAGDHPASWRASSARTRSRPRARSSTTSKGSASRSRTRRGRSTRGAGSRTGPTRSAATSVVVHELAHQWTGDYLALAGVAAHLAQRGLRDLQRVAVERARGPRHGAGDLRRPTRRSRPTTRSGRWRSATRGRTASSTARSTTAAR